MKWDVSITNKLQYFYWCKQQKMKWHIKTVGRIWRGTRNKIKLYIFAILYLNTLTSSLRTFNKKLC